MFLKVFAEHEVGGRLQEVAQLHRQVREFYREERAERRRTSADVLEYPDAIGEGGEAGNNDESSRDLEYKHVKSRYYCSL